MLLREYFRFCGHIEKAPEQGHSTDYCPLSDSSKHICFVDEIFPEYGDKAAQPESATIRGRHYFEWTVEGRTSAQRHASGEIDKARFVVSDARRD
jgi:hypothetical protein